MTKQEKVWIFEREIQLIHSPDIRGIVRRVLAETPDGFFIARASSSGKYHAVDECTEGGLILHTKRVVKMAAFLAGNPEWYEDMKRNNFMPYDGLIAAAILHDCCKSGNPWGDRTVGDHPQIAAKLVLDVCGVTPITQAIARTIETHMGYAWGDRTWGDSANAPQTLCQKLLHMADMLASRKWLSIDVTEGL